MVVINLINPAGSAGGRESDFVPACILDKYRDISVTGKGSIFQSTLFKFSRNNPTGLCMHIFNNKNNIFYFIYIYIHTYISIVAFNIRSYNVVSIWQRCKNCTNLPRNAIFLYSRFPRLNKLSCSANVFHRATIFVDIFDTFSWFIL